MRTDTGTREELLEDSEALRSAATLMAELDCCPNDIALVLEGAEIASRRAEYAP